jgi:hypothetical protein
VPQHVTRLVVDYSASRRLVVDYFGYAARPVASARRVARRAARRLARRRLLRLRHAFGWLGSLRGSLSTTSTTPRVRLLWHVVRHIAPLVVDYFGSRMLVVDYFATLRVRVPRHVARLVTRLIVDYFASRRLVVDYFAYAARLCASARRAVRQAARRRLLHLRRASGCFGSSRGLSRDSSSTTSPTPRVRVPRNVARLVKRLVVNYFTYAARPVASARRAACRVTHR